MVVKQRAAAPGRLAGTIVHLLKTHALGTAGGLVLFLMFVTAMLGPLLFPGDPMATSAAERLKGPSLEHLLGTDELGRDVLARVIYGTRITMLAGLVATMIGTSVGAAVGIVSAYLGGKIDLGVQRIMDVLLAFPILVLALAISAGLGSSTRNVVIAIALPFVPRTNRVVRSAALAIKELTYVEAARASGFPPWRIVVRHVALNCLAPYIVMCSILLGQAIIVEASLSFLGLGVPEPAPSWGRSLSSAMPYFQRAPWLAIFPGAAIALAVLGANLLGDTLRDVLDPRLRVP